MVNDIYCNNDVNLTICTMYLHIYIYKFVYNFFSVHLIINLSETNVFVGTIIVLLLEFHRQNIHHAVKQV